MTARLLLSRSGRPTGARGLFSMSRLPGSTRSPHVRSIKRRLDHGDSNRCGVDDDNWSGQQARVTRRFTPPWRYWELMSCEG